MGTGGAVGHGPVILTVPYKAREVEREVLEVEGIAKALENLELRVVSFLGGEPTTNPKLQEMVGIVKNKFNVHTRILTNGSNPIPQGHSAAFSAFLPNDEFGRHLLDRTGA